MSQSDLEHAHFLRVCALSAIFARVGSVVDIAKTRENMAKLDARWLRLTLTVSE